MPGKEITLELKQLQFFVVSVDMGSFKRAAEVLYTTQPHISKTIKTLERELHTELFERNISGVTMTEAGKKVYAYASSILQKVEVIEQVGTENSGQSLRVSAVAGGNLAELFALFCKMKQGDDIYYQFTEGKVEEIMGHMHHRSAELGLVYVARRRWSGFAWQLEHKRLEFVPLKQTSPCLIVGKNNPLYGLSSVDSSALHTVRLIRPAEDFCSIGAPPGYLKENDPQRRDSRAAVDTNSIHVTEQLLRYTDMGTIGCSLFRKPYAGNGQKAIPLADLKDSIAFGYIKRKKDRLTPIASEFVAYLKRILQEKS